MYKQARYSELVIQREQANNRYRTLVGESQKAKERLESIRKELALLCCPFSVGEEIVLRREFQGTKRAIISSIEPPTWSSGQAKYSLELVPLKPTGEHMNALISADNSPVYMQIGAEIDLCNFERHNGKEPIELEG